MRNCQQRCRPCCSNQGWNHGGGCGRIETIVHPTVHCRSEHHHHQRVRNIVPVVFHQAHHHHRHHEYEVRRRHTQEHNHHEHGRRKEDWCNPRHHGNQGNCGGGQSHCGGGQSSCGGGQSNCGGGQGREFFEPMMAEEAGFEFDEQMFS